MRNLGWVIFTNKVRASGEITAKPWRITLPPRTRATRQPRTILAPCTSAGRGFEGIRDRPHVGIAPLLIAGNVTAQCNLASLYFRGRGVARDYAQAAIWFRAAAERSYAPAQDNLAWMYYNGTGVTLDYSEAAKWVQRAAEQGYPRAQIDLGHLYEQGKGVPLNYVSAYTWYKLAVMGGDERGRARMESLSRLMTQAQISEANNRAAQVPGSRLSQQEVSNSNYIKSSFAEQR